MRKLLINTTGRPDTVFSPLGERVNGLIYIAQGVNMLLHGKNVPGWTLKYAFWGAQNCYRLRGDGA